MSIARRARLCALLSVAGLLAAVPAARANGIVFISGAVLEFNDVDFAVDRLEISQAAQTDADGTVTALVYRLEDTSTPTARNIDENEAACTGNGTSEVVCTVAPTMPLDVGTSGGADTVAVTSAVTDGLIR